MFGYDFEIIYKKGKKNVVADALSRKDEWSLQIVFKISSTFTFITTISLHVATP